MESGQESGAPTGRPILWREAAEVKKVEWQMTRSGLLHPMVSAQSKKNHRLKSINAYNAEYALKNGIAPGAVLSFMLRRNGATAEIEKVLERAPEESLSAMKAKIASCPYCGSHTVEKIGGEIACENPDCKALKMAKAAYFYQTVQKGVGPVTVKKMFDAGFDSLFRILNAAYSDLARIKGLTQKEANALLKANSQIRKGVDPVKLMVASCCFENLGEAAIAAQVKAMSDGERWALLNGRMDFAPEFFESKAFNNSREYAKRIYRGVSKFYDFLAENRVAILNPSAPKARLPERKWIKVCVIGSQDKAVEDAVYDSGGTVCSEVDSKTTHVVSRYPNANSNNLKRARKRKLPIMLPDEFLKYMYSYY